MPIAVVMPEMRVMPAADATRAGKTSGARRSSRRGAEQHHNREGAENRLHDFTFSCASEGNARRTQLVRFLFPKNFIYAR
jgi:hypothetical protein